MRSQPFASRSLRIPCTRVSSSERFPSFTPITFTWTSCKPLSTWATSGCSFSINFVASEIRLLVTLTSTNSPPEGDEKVPKSTCPGGSASPQTLTATASGRIAVPRAHGMKYFIFGLRSFHLELCHFRNIFVPLKPIPERIMKSFRNRARGREDKSFDRGLTEERGWENYLILIRREIRSKVRVGLELLTASSFDGCELAWCRAAHRVRKPQ